MAPAPPVATPTPLADAPQPTVLLTIARCFTHPANISQLRCHACWCNSVSCAKSALVRLKSILRANRSPSRQSSTAHARRTNECCNGQKWERATALIENDVFKNVNPRKGRYLCCMGRESCAKQTIMQGTVADVPRLSRSTHVVDDLLHTLRQENILMFRSMSNALYRWDYGGGITAVGHGFSWF